MAWQSQYGTKTTVHTTSHGWTGPWQDEIVAGLDLFFYCMVHSCEPGSSSVQFLTGRLINAASLETWCVGSDGSGWRGPKAVVICGMSWQQWLEQKLPYNSGHSYVLPITSSWKNKWGGGAPTHQAVYGTGLHQFYKVNLAGEYKQLEFIIVGEHTVQWEKFLDWGECLVLLPAQDPGQLLLQYSV